MKSSVWVWLAGMWMSGALGCAATGPAQVEPVYGPTNPEPAAAEPGDVTRYASIIGLKPGMEEKYRELHADVWPQVRAAIHEANIRNYSIWIAEIDGEKYLFSYFEYTGDDPKADFAKMAEDPTTREKWWPITDAAQRRLPGTPEGQQWKRLERLMVIE